MATMSQELGQPSYEQSDSSLSKETKTIAIYFPDLRNQRPLKQPYRDFRLKPFQQ